MLKKIPQNGISKTRHDTRDFSLAGMYRQIDIKEVPKVDFETRVPLVKDQGNETDTCSAFAVTSVSEDQELVELVPEFQFYVTKMLISKDPDSWGADLRDACLSVAKYGSLPRYAIEQGFRVPQNRDLILNKDSWLPEWFDLAAAYKKATVFKVDGRYDTFDNIRTALWQFRNEKRSLVGGVSWQSAWTDMADGLINEDTGEEGFGHALKIYGQKIINGIPYLKVQLSNGTAIGDKGIFYFSRDVVNKTFTEYGQFMFKDIERKTVEVYKTQGIRATDNFFIKLVAFIKHFLNIK